MSRTIVQQNAGGREAQAPQDTEAAAQGMMRMLTGFWASQCLHVAARVSVADALQAGPQSVTALAHTLNLHEESLYRLLRALSSLGIFEEQADRHFALTPQGDLLREESPGSMRAIALMLGRENYAAWSRLEDAVRTGQSPFESAYGMPVYDYFGQHPDAAQTFNAAMTALVRNDNGAILDSYDFGAFGSLVDIGGGHGMLLAAILQRFPQVSAVLFDLPEVAAGAASLLESAGVQARCQLQGGDFYQAVPPGADGYILSRVLHGFDDAHGARILANTAQAMPAHAKLLLMEFVLEPGNHPESARTKLMDVNMMVFAAGGRDRTEAEYAHLLAGAGLRLTRVIPTRSGIAILEAEKRA